MRVLWVVNTLMPEVAERFGMTSGHAISWVAAMSVCLKRRDDMELAIVSPVKNTTQFKNELDGIVYYFVCRNSSVNEWQHILDNFDPDIIHVYGTEWGHALPLIKMHQEVPIVISLQGLLTEYQRFYYAGMDVTTILKNITFRDLIKGTIIHDRRDFQKRAVREQEMLRSVKYVEGRTAWDRVSAMRINPELTYYHCPRLLRDAFYHQRKWKMESAEPHSIFVHQGMYPIKGLHIMLEALQLLRNKYPDVKMYVAGNDRISCPTFKQKLKRNGYAKYVKKLIDRWNLGSSVFFTGFLDAEKMADRLLRSNVMVIPSAIENAPNSLAEAEVLGVPCVASYVGGNPEMLRDGQDGFLYCYNEPALLADKIGKIFDNPDLAQRFSESAREFALKRHDPATLERTLVGIYEDILLKEGKL